MKQLDTLIGKPLTLRECLIVIEIIVIVIVFVIIIVTVVVIVIVITEIKSSKDQKPTQGERRGLSHPWRMDAWILPDKQAIIIDYHNNHQNYDVFVILHLIRKHSELLSGSTSPPPGRKLSSSPSPPPVRRNRCNYTCCHCHCCL